MQEAAILLRKNNSYQFEILRKELADLKCQLIYTKGMTAYTQPCDDQWQDFQHIELFFLLPDYWNLEEKPWPVDWLEKIAEVPQKKQTWFRPGDSLSTGFPPVLIDEKMPKAHNFLLVRPQLATEYLTALENGFKFLGIIPVFDDELQFKMDTSGTALIHLLNSKGIQEKVDVFRVSAKKKKFLGLF